MRVLIVGAGGLGTVLAGFLARSGVDVTLFVKPAQRAAFPGPEVRIEGAVDFTAPVRVVSEPDVLDPVDYIIVCVKARDTEAALAPLLALSFGAALSLQNGVGKNDLLIERFGRERVLGAVTYIAGTLVSPGRARTPNPASTFVGELNGSASSRCARLAAAIEGSGLPAACVSNIAMLEWYKLAIFLRTALVASITQRDVAALAADVSLRRVCARVAAEIIAVAAAEGQILHRRASEQFGLADSAVADSSAPAIDATVDEIAETLALLGETLGRQGRSFYPSLAQDVMAGRPTELEATAGDVLARAACHGLSVPTLQTCTELLRGIERAAASPAISPSERR